MILSAGENLEIEPYLLLPALLILGIHARELYESARPWPALRNSRILENGQ